MPSAFTRAIAAGCALALAAPAAVGQEPRPPAVFGADVDLVAVDVNVVDGDGRPVRGLAPGDFALTVDGSPRRLVSAEFIDLGGGDDEPAPPPEVGDFSTNEGARRGRVLVIAVDQGGIRPGAGRHVVRSAERLLSRLGPRDRVALLTMPGGGPQVELTSEHDRVREALRRVDGRAGFAGRRRLSLSEALLYDDDREYEWNEVVRRLCAGVSGLGLEGCARDLELEASSTAWSFRQQSEVAMKGLHLLMESLQQVEGAKTVVLVTEGLRSERVGDLRDLAVKAAAARVAFYAVRIEHGGPDPAHDTAPSTPFEDEALVTRDLHRLAGLTRGEVFRSAGSAVPFERIAREMSGHYLLGFEPQDDDRDGKDHVISVSVRRPGLTVRARRSLPLAAGTALTGRKAVESALRFPDTAGDLPLRVATYAFQDRAQPSKVRVLVSAEVGGGGARHGLTVGFALVGEKGRVAASAVQEVTRAAAASSGLGPVPYFGSAVVEPDRYTLKLAAVDGRGRRGSVEHAVKAALTAAGPLELTDLLLAPAADRPGSALRPAVEAASERGALAAYLELHGPEEALQAARVRLEVATAESGPPLAQGDLTLAGGPSLRIGQGLLSVAHLPPGRYVARAVLSWAGRPVGQVTRRFRVPAAGQDRPGG